MNSFYELRMYRVEPGRIQDMASRWHEDLSVLFKRHGVKPVGAWQALTGPDLPLFVYLMPWPDYASRQAAWAGFYGDPQWPEARMRTNAGSELVERFDLNFLQEILPWSEPGGHAYTELRIINVRIGAGAAARAAVKERIAGEVGQLGGRILAALEFMTGADLPAIAVLVNWPDAEQARKADPLFQVQPLEKATIYQLAQI